MPEDNGDPLNNASTASVGHHEPTVREERLDWLACLISSYEQEHHWGTDEDPDATRECIAECRALLGELRKELPTPEPDTWQLGTCRLCDKPAPVNACGMCAACEDAIPF